MKPDNEPNFARGGACSNCGEHWESHPTRCGHSAPIYRPMAHQEGGSHYKNLPIQPVEYCHRNKLGFCESSAIKYLTRWRDKGGLSDLKKAKHFIELLIEMESVPKPG